MEEHLYPHFYEIENTHWWFAARQRILHEVMEKKVRLPRGARLLDVGCGTGAILDMFSREYETYGQDVSPQAIEFCRKRGLKNLFCGPLDQFPATAPGFDVVTALDVLEHVDDDSGMLKQISRLLKADGRVLITVPAFPGLWGPHDVVTHHKRRYVKSSLRRVVELSGFRVEYLSYFNFFLLPVAVVRRIAARLTRAADASDLRMPSPALNTMLRFVFETEKHILPRFRLPFGLSLLSVARKVGMPPEHREVFGF